ncbi:MAG: hypothetical protein HY721_27790 [Planctomycetes bacterium]|nr:hypothetical protein [Planctomycetota bacterium]
MRRERSDIEQDQREQSRRREALDVLFEARDRLLAQMADDILANRDALLEGREGLSSFELEEIEDRYSARLNALNALLENLEDRQPQVRHHVETLTTTYAAIDKDLLAALARFDEWDLVDVNVLPRRGEELFVVLSLTCDEYPE